MKKAGLGVLALAVLVVVMWWLLPADGGGPGDKVVDASVSNAASAVTATSATAATTHAKATTSLADYARRGGALGALPASLQGTQVDGHLAADAEGNLVVSAGVRQVFDYFLSTLGEESLDDVKARIALYLSQKLPATAAQQAWDLLGHYLDYQQSLSTLPAQQAPVGDSLDELQQVIAQRRQLRESWLGDAASAAFFGPEEAYDNYTLTRMQVEQDTQLGATEKQQRLDQLKASLPAEVSDMIDATMAPAEVADKVDAMRAQGASEADIQAYRTSQFGPEAAERFKALDAERAAWQSRYDDYRQQRQSILDAGLAANDQTSEIAALRERLFAAGEQKRVAALDDMTTDAASTGKNDDEAKK